MKEHEFFQSEHYGAKWGWIRIGEVLKPPRHEPEVLAAIERARQKPFVRGMFFDKLV